MLSSSYYDVGLLLSYYGVDLSLVCYDMMFFIILLRHFICIKAFIKIKHIRSTEDIKSWSLYVKDIKLWSLYVKEIESYIL